MGWLTDATFEGGAFWRDIFITTHLGWVHLITGPGIGLGMALATNALRASDRWVVFLQEQSRITGFRQTVEVIRGIMRIVLANAWPLPLMIGLAAVTALHVLDLQPFSPMPGANSAALGWRLFGDCATQAIGAYFGIVGMCLGVVAQRHGFSVEAGEGQL